jgi:hypothetical protein
MYVRIIDWFMYLFIMKELCIARKCLVKTRFRDNQQEQSTSEQRPLNTFLI